MRKGDKVLSVPFYEQKEEYYCGPASVLQVFAYLNTTQNKHYTLPTQYELAEALGTTREGTDTCNMKNYLNQKFDANYSVLWSWKDETVLSSMVIADINAGYPMIPHLIIGPTSVGRSSPTDPSKWPYTTDGHYVTLNGHRANGTIFHITDPYVTKVMSGYSSGKYTVTNAITEAVCDRIIK